MECLPGTLACAPIFERVTLDLGAERLERASVAVGRLGGLALLLPEPRRLVHLLVRKEAVLSAQVEGATTSLCDVLLAESEGTPSPVLRHAEALAEGVERLRGGATLSAALLLDLHARLEPDRPCEPEAERLAEVEAILRDGGPVLPRAAAAVAIVERQRPFPWGNGATARMLVPLLLYGEGMLEAPLLYPSLWFRAHRDRYRVAVESDAAWGPFFVEGIASAAEHAVVALRSMVSLLAADREAVGPAPDALRVLDAFVRHPRARAERIATATGFDGGRVAEALERLGRQRIVVEVEPGLHAYRAWVELLDEGTIVRARGPQGRHR